MKTRHTQSIIAIAAIALSSSAFAQTKPKETPELKAAKARYQTEAQTALKPIQARHASQMESLLRTYTQRGDLSAALAVQQELDTLKSQSAAAPGSAAIASKRALEAAVGQVWIPVGGGSYYESNKDRTGKCGGVRYTWEVESNGTVTFSEQGESKRQATMRLDTDLKTSTGVGFDGKPFTAKPHP